MNVSNWFFRLGVIAVLIGMSLGVWMGKEENFTLAPVHAHLNLLGYVSMFLYGFFYRSFPASGAGLLSKLHFALAVLGVVLMVPGLAMMLLGQTQYIPMLMAGEAVAVLGMLVFAVVVFKATGGRQAMAAE